MKIIQEKIYKPISIVLDNKREATIFFGFIDRLEAGQGIILTDDEISLINQISDAYGTEVNL